MFKVQRNEKTPNIVEFYHKEYKEGKEPEITLNEDDGTLILYKTFKRTSVQINVLFRMSMKKEKRRITEEEKQYFMSQIKEKCSHMGDTLRINEALMDYNWFETDYNRCDFLWRAD